jgi:uncharacterized protein YmfQ (DUF2313 family)
MTSLPPDIPSKDNPDRHIRRYGDDYVYSFLSLLPRGQAWPRSLDSTLVRACDGLARYWGDVDARAATLLEVESDPRQTVELLPDWERAFGLPDPCFPDAMTIEERQRMLVLHMIWLGGQSRQYFIDLANYLGYTVTIEEYSPFMAGVSNCGDTRPAPSERYRWYIGPPEMRFVWTVHVGARTLVWFRVTVGQAGVDPHLNIDGIDDLECLFERWKPVHTDVVFDYTDTGNPMEGTP